MEISRQTTDTNPIFTWLRSLFAWALMVIITIIMAPLIAFFALINRETSFRLTRVMGRALLKTVGAKLTVINQTGFDAPPKGAVYVSNHQSYLDIVCLVLAFEGGFRFLAKRSLIILPGINIILWGQKHIFVDQAKPAGALRKLRKTAPDILSAGDRIFIFPEGERSWDGTLGEFKDGAAAVAIWAQAPIVPTAIIGTREILPRGNWPVGKGEIKVIVGAPMETKGLGVRERKELTDKTKKWIDDAIAKGENKNRN